MTTHSFFRSVFALVLGAALFAASVFGQAASTIWNASSRILILGDQHTSVEQGAAFQADLPSLKKAGMTQLAVEVPSFRQVVLDEFVAQNRSTEWLAKNLFFSSLSSLDKAYAVKVAIIEWARANSVKVTAIDADETLFHAIGSATKVAKAGKGNMIDDPDAAELAAKRGVLPEHKAMTTEQATKAAWNLWVNGRTQAMARNLAKLAATSEGRVVAVLGNVHIEFGGFKGFFLRSGADVRETPTLGVKDYLPESLKISTQSVLVLGGFSYKGSVSALLTSGQLHPIESALVSKGAAAKALAVRSLSGFGTVDSFLFVPMSSRS